MAEFKNIIKDQDRELLKKDIIQAELNAGIEYLNKNSSPGRDGVTEALLKEIFKVKPKILLQYLNHIKNKGSQKAFLIVYKILKKPGKETYENYRPII